MLIDSDVLVWLTRGRLLAAQRLQALNPWRISAVTYIELAQDCRDKAELVRLKKGLAARQTEIVPYYTGHLAAGGGIDRRVGAVQWAVTGRCADRCYRHRASTPAAHGQR